MSRRLSSRSIAASVVSDINRSLDELVNELSCIGSALSMLLIVVTADVLTIDSHIGGVAGAVRKAVGTRRSFA